MTSTNFERIEYDSRPHEAFDKNWSGYSISDFGSVFLPYASTYQGPAMLVHDGAGLFADMRINRESVLVLEDSSSTRFSVFTYAETAAAASGRQKISVAANEASCFVEVDQQGVLKVAFKLGSGFRTYLNGLAANNRDVITAEDVESFVYQPTIEQFREYFEGEVSNDSLTSLVLDIAGADAASAEAEQSMAALEAAAKLIGDGYYFDAGEIKATNPDAWSHGDIEQRALKESGFDDPEIRKVYLGNWLRDYASLITSMAVGFTREDQQTLKTNAKTKNIPLVKQMLHLMERKPTHDGLVNIVKILTVKEFIYNKEKKPSEDYYVNEKKFIKKFGEITKDMLGVYRPEEHIDNPKALVDESFLGWTWLLKKPILVQHEYAKGKKRAQTLYSGEDKKSLAIKDGLKYYIKNELPDAEDLKKAKGKELPVRPSSLAYFGEQLRLAKAYGRNTEGFRHLGAALHVLEDYYAHSNFVEIALIKNGFTKVHPWVETDISGIKEPFDKARKLDIVTGMFGTDDTIASLAPKVAKVMFPTDWKEYKSLKEGVRTFSDALIVAILKDYAKKEAAVPAEQKTRILGQTFDDLLGIYNTFLGWRDAMARLKSLPVIGDVVGAVGSATHYMFQMLMYFPNIIMNELLSSTTEAIKYNQSRKSGYGTDPTHTQLAKDEHDHPLNLIAGRLAFYAVLNIGKQMADCWKGKKNIEDVIAWADERYFIHPCDLPAEKAWYDGIVFEWAGKHKDDVEKAASKTATEHYVKKTKELINLTKEQIEALKKKPPVQHKKAYAPKKKKRRLQFFRWPSYRAKF